MRINLVPIGNSQGIRLPKTVIEQAQLTEVLDLEVARGAIIIRSAHDHEKTGSGTQRPATQRVKIDSTIGM